MRNHVKLSVVVLSITGGLLATWQGCAPSGGFGLENTVQTSELSSVTPGGVINPTPTDGTCTDTGIDAAPVQRLTKLEYNNVIRDLFGLTKDYSAGFLKDGEGPAGFSTEGSGQNLSLTVVKDYWTASKTVVDDLFARNPNPLLTCNSGEACARTILTKLTTRAFRRPATDEELTRLINIFKGSSSQVFTDALKLSVRAILVSPQFIYRTYEVSPTGAAMAYLSSYEIASRLSFFLWGSIPDEALLSDAAEGKLLDSAVLLSHTRRMMADPRISYISKSFASDWLKLSKLDAVTLDAQRFPTWNAALKQSMKNETLNFFNNVITTNQSVMNLINSPTSFVDQRLSQHYGVAGANSDQFVQVNLGPNRFGVLTHASVLTMTSTSTRTSPVVRGKWFLEQILCSGTGAPPADIPIVENSDSGKPFTESQIRDRLVAHAKQGAACTACHRSLDPIGLAYENYDAAGVFRTKYPDGVAVDASGQLPTGEQLRDFTDLAKVVQNDARFKACFTQKLASFSMGTTMNTVGGKCMSRNIASAAIGNDKKFSDLVEALVLNEAFRVRKIKY